MAVNVGTAQGFLDLNIAGFTTGLKTAQSEASKATQSMSKSVSSNLTKMGDGFQSVGKKMTLGITTPLVGVAGAGMKMAMDFEAGMSEVGAISGATGEDMVKLTAKAKEMGATTKFSATESSEALKYMAMAGWDTEKMMSGLPGVMNLAAASGEDLGLVSDIVTDSMTAFGLEASKAGDFADVLATASSRSNTNVSMLGESFKYVAPVAGSLGYTAEDTAVALGLMANAGIKGSQAGTSLRTAMVNMAKPSKEMQSSLDYLNLSMTDQAGNIKPLNVLLGEMRERFSNLTEKQKAQHAASIFGKNSMAGMLAIINTSDEDFNSLTDSINNSTGAAQKMADTMNDNLTGQVTLLKSAMESVAIEMADFVLPALKKVTGVVTDAVGAFSQLDEGTKLTVLKLTGVAAATGPALVGFGKLTSGVGSVYGAFDKLSGTIGGAVGKTVQSVSGMATDVGSKFSSMATGASSAFGNIVNTVTSVPGPIGDVFSTIGVKALDLGGSIGGVTSLIGEKFAGVSKAVGPVNNALKGAFGVGTELATGMTKTIAGLAKFALGAVGPAALVGLALVGLGALEGEFGTQIDAFVKMAIEKGPGIIQGLVDGMVKKIPDLITQGTTLVAKLADVITTNLPVIVQSGVKLIGSLVKGVGDNSSSLMKSIGSVLGSVLNSIIDALPQFIVMGMDLLISLSKGMIDNLPALLNGTENVLGNLTKKIEQYVPVIISKGVELLQNLAAGIVQALPRLIETGVSMIGTLINVVSDNLPTLLRAGIDILITLATGIFEALPQMMASAGQIIQSLIIGIVENIPVILQAGFELVIYFAKGLIENLPAIAMAGVELIKGLVGGIFGAIPKLFTGVFDAVKNIGSTIWGWVTGKNKEGADETDKVMSDMVASVDTSMNEASSSVQISTTSMFDSIDLNMGKASSSVSVFGTTMNQDYAQNVGGMLSTTSTMFPQMSEIAGTSLLGEKKAVTTASTDMSTAYGSNVKSMKDMSGKEFEEMQTVATGKARKQKENVLSEAQMMKNRMELNNKLMLENSSLSFAGMEKKVSTSMSGASKTVDKHMDDISGLTRSGFMNAADGAGEGTTDMTRNVDKGMSDTSKEVVEAMKIMNMEVMVGFDKMLKAFANGMSGILKDFSSKSSDAIGISKAMRTGVAGAVSGMSSTMASSGANAGAGFYSGLSSKRKSILDMAGSIARGVTGTINKVLQIHSPSRATGWSATMAVLGFLNPMKEGVKKVEKVSDEIADAAQPEIEIDKVDLNPVESSLGMLDKMFSGLEVRLETFNDRIKQTLIELVDGIDGVVSKSRGLSLSLAKTESVRTTIDGPAIIGRQQLAPNQAQWANGPSQMPERIDYERLAETIVSAIKKNPIVAETHLDGKQLSLAVDRGLGIVRRKGDQYATEW